MTSQPTPFELVTALRTSDGGARTVLEAWCAESIARLVATVAERLGPTSGDPAMLTRRAMRWVEMYLRARDPFVYQGLGRKTFLISLMVAAYRWLDPIDPNGREARPMSPGEPDSDVYDVRVYTRPLERVGGDWWDHDFEQGGVLWIVVGDVTGHGYPAYLLAAGLPHLWRASAIAELRATTQEPRELLSALGRELEMVLPDDLFVEAILGRFASTGEAVVAAAGGFHPILRRSKVDLLEFPSLSGCFLGLELGGRDQCAWSLDDGDELLLATDGLFDQPCGAEERLGKELSSRCRQQLASSRALHEAILAVLGEVLGQQPQHDDITVVTLRRCSVASATSRRGDAGM